MFIGEEFDDFFAKLNLKDKKADCDSLDLIQLVHYWKQTLLTLCLNIFLYEDLPVPPQDLDYYLMIHGHAGIVPTTDGPIVARGEFYGVTDYADRYTGYIWSTPLRCGDTPVEQMVECRNTKSKMSLRRLIHRYTYLLAHADLTFQAALINSRTNRMVAADNQAAADSVELWYKGLVQGKNLAVLDSNDLNSELDSPGLRSIDTMQAPAGLLRDSYEATRNVLRSFFNDIGIRCTDTKKERMITDEVQGDTDMLLSLVDDMLEQRRQICRNIEKVFGIKCSVKLNRQMIDMTQEQEGGYKHDGAADSE